MRVSVVNFCSSRVDMLDFSTEMLIANAGTGDFDYVVVVWNPTSEVEQWLVDHPRCIRADYRADPALNFVPNLRAQMNMGWDVGYALNDYVAIVNTDMAFGRGWLVNLGKHATPDVIPNSVIISPITGSNIVTANFGVPTRDTFDLAAFWKLHDKLFADRIETDEQRGSWRATQSLPYVVHRKWWEKYGPWGVEYDHVNRKPPDWLFFERCHDAGVKYVMVFDSICYHHEAVERRGGRPPGIEGMPEGL